MSEMIERVARAVKSLGDAVITYEDLARAAITAMREPTDGMVEAAVDAEQDNHTDIWRAMIDGALAEGDGELSEVEITPEMVQAGFDALYKFDITQPAEKEMRQAVSAVFSAMIAAKRG